METPVKKLSKEQVIAHLEANPDFLTQNPEVLEFLRLPQYQTGDRVLDMQLFTIDKLREQIEVLRKINDELILCSRDNMSAQAQVHKAVVGLLEAGDLPELLNVIQHDLPPVFDVDVIRLCLEDTVAEGIAALETGHVAALFTKDTQVLLGPVTEAQRPMFGESSQLVQSAALIRLHLPQTGREGLLAFGVRDPKRFHPGQGTELLRFLARVAAFALENRLPVTQAEPAAE